MTSPNPPTEGARERVARIINECVEVERRDDIASGVRVNIIKGADEAADAILAALAEQPRSEGGDAAEAFHAGWGAHERFTDGPSAVGYPDNSADAWDFYYTAAPPPPEPRASETFANTVKSEADGREPDQALSGPKGTSAKPQETLTLPEAITELERVAMLFDPANGNQGQYYRTSEAIRAVLGALQTKGAQHD